VLLIPRAVRILLAAQRVDMRNSIDGLAAVIRNQWKEDLYAGDLFVFVSRRGDRAKVLTWDNGGFVLYYKRLEQGRFRLPDFREDALGARLQSSQLAMLLDGIDVSRVRRPKQWVPPHPPPQTEESVISTRRWYQAPRTTTARGGTRQSASGESSPASGKSRKRSAGNSMRSNGTSSAREARRCRRSPRSSAPSGR
jgi:IS66 Orf2 like protein